MSTWVRGSVLAVFGAIMAISPVLAANTPASGAKSISPALASPAAGQLPALSPAATAAPGRAALPLQSVQTARVPFEASWNSTVLAANSQAMGLQVSRRSQASPTRMAIAGAAIGAIVGAVAGDPLSDAAIGGVVGFGIGYVMHR